MGPPLPVVALGAVQVHEHRQPILDDDPVPGLSVGDVTLAEGNAGSKIFTFTVRLSAPSGRAVQVAYATAVAGADYASASGTLTIAAGATFGTVAVTVNALVADGEGIGTILDDDTAALRASRVAPVGRGATAAPTPGQLAALVDAALAQWDAAGVQTAALRGLQVRLANLPGTELGRAEAGVVLVDADAAGWGWFVDQTPGESREFRPHVRGPAAGRIDLLTVLAHELGHLLGRDHAEGGVMADVLGPGVRRHVRPPEFVAARGRALDHPSGGISLALSRPSVEASRRRGRTSRAPAHA